MTRTRPEPEDREKKGVVLKPDKPANERAGQSDCVVTVSVYCCFLLVLPSLARCVRPQELSQLTPNWFARAQAAQAAGQTQPPDSRTLQI